ncbi:MAG: hypothetical protein MR411_06495 [Tenericutes bacterium]|nr:hypothetical protein [Mycoplasmatota bacterium]
MNNIIFFVGMIIASIIEYKLIRLIDKKEKLKIARWENDIKYKIDNNIPIEENKKRGRKLYDSIKNIISNMYKYINNRKNNV